MNAIEATEYELHAYLDRELDPARALVVQASLAQDEALTARVQAILAQKQALHAAFDTVLAEPLPRDLDTWLSERLGKRSAWGAARASIDPEPEA